MRAWVFFTGEVKWLFGLHNYSLTLFSVAIPPTWTPSTTPQPCVLQHRPYRSSQQWKKNGWEAAPYKIKPKHIRIYDCTNAKEALVEASGHLNIPLQAASEGPSHGSLAADVTNIDVASVFKQIKVWEESVSPLGMFYCMFHAESASQAWQAWLYMVQCISCVRSLYETPWVRAAWM